MGCAQAGSVPSKYVFPFPLMATFVSKEGSYKASETHALTEIQCSACAGVCGFAQMEPTVMCFPWCGLPDLALHCGVELSELEHMLGLCWGMKPGSHGNSSRCPAIRSMLLLGCSFVNTNNSYCSPTWAMLLAPGSPLHP